ncbi:heme-dependent oxidative N-demethylase family protein [Roseibium sp.]|uniref:heme-dependent oxidative N-demethylase family protein n=1 Tax=Roseibium sp. TaxID=1936156 RepID=UPI003A969102
MAFRHTPYDGSKRPFTVGLEPVDVSRWLDPDGHLVVHLKRKAELLETVHSRVFRAESGTEAAQREVLDLILEDLAAHHRATHSVSSDVVEVLNDGPRVRLTDYAPLEAASRLVQEDLVLMRKGEDGYRLAAASLCFPSSWSLAEKFGRSMHAIHDNVPGFNDGRMGPVVARIFDNLTADQLVGRYNWSIYDDPDLHHPQAKQLAPQIEEKGAGALAHLFVRVERQTLRRLPKSGDILFTIKIHHDPISLLKTHERGAELAAGLAAQLRELDDRQIAYKGLTQYRTAIAEELETFAPSAPEAV